MHNDIFVSYFIPTVNSNPRCVTSCLGPMLPICNPCQDVVSQDGLANFGDDKKRQEQVEHDRVGCRSLGVLLPQRRLAMWQSAELTGRGERGGGSPGRTPVWD